MSARTAASRRSAAGAMSERIHRWLTGVVHRDPEDVRRELFSNTPCFFVCGLLHQTSAQYSAAEKTRVWMEMRSVFVAAPQVVLARWRIRQTQDVVFADSFSRCCWKVRAWLSFTPRYVGVASNCSMLPSTMTLSSRLASQLLRE